MPKNRRFGNSGTGITSLLTLLDHAPSAWEGRWEGLQGIGERGGGAGSGAYGGEAIADSRWGFYRKYSVYQCCGSGSGSGRIRSFLVTRIRIRENTGSGSGSFIHKKTPCYLNFLVIKLSKIQFRPKNFLIFDFTWHNNFLSLILSVI